ncbi:MAG: aminotransferase class I/II-fold pyridoxal phosphate-dependent enzyme, partial [Acaryochloridaceae cyanobacterium CSU_5_19]|nr:aminotransferase class I/II-fold pyridoxal phosphate-dependent enzyme [Acaryochloridaceae cyanobacterium CSU_5_19]
DNLFAPTSVIQSAQCLAAEAFGAEHTWFLVNGSTAGVIAAIVATCGPGEQIILPRNSHVSVISGLILAGASPVFVPPEYDLRRGIVYGLTPGAIATALAAYPQAKAILLVYPTYEGICSDISAIATLAHRHDIPLLVDEAHGPHFHFHPDLPSSALRAGADLVVQSTHKILGSLTQTAMLHMQGNRVERQRISQALQLVQSTSPNYLLLASLDLARRQMALGGEGIMTEVMALAWRARSQLQAQSGLEILTPEQSQPAAGFVSLDPTRITLFTAALRGDGFQIDQRLMADFGVAAELVTLEHLTFLISLGNTEQDIQRLVAAVRQLRSSAHTPLQPEIIPDKMAAFAQPYSTPELLPREAYWSAQEVVPWQRAGHRISAEWVCPYPPGIPAFIPGERIQPSDLDLLLQIHRLGGKIMGCADVDLRTLKVVRD